MKLNKIFFFASLIICLCVWPAASEQTVRHLNETDIHPAEQPPAEDTYPISDHRNQTPARHSQSNDQKDERPESNVVPPLPDASKELKKKNPPSEDTQTETPNAVKIIIHPESQTIVSGERVTFSVTATGKPPLSFQWKKNHINIQGATSQTYTIDAVQKDDEGNYSCEVSNKFSNDISDMAVLTLQAPQQPPISAPSYKNSKSSQQKTAPADSGPAEFIVKLPPRILLHPSDRIRNPGDSVTFSVDASGTPPLSFQWGKSGKPITGATGPSYTIDAVTEKDEGIYYCIVTNAFGEAKSDAGWLKVNDPVSIIHHPGDQTIEAGKPVTFSVAASGEPPLRFQWKKNHINIQGAFSETYTIESVQEKDEAVYSCEVSNDFSNEISDDATLKLQVPPPVTDQPASQPPVAETSKDAAVPESEKALSPSSTDSDQRIASQENNQEKNTDQLQATEATATKEAGPEKPLSSDIIISISPEILQHPYDQQKNPGESVTFSITASGTPPLSFQWQKDGKEIDGATGQNYTIDPVKKEDAGTYTCEVKNMAGSVQSHTAHLSVTEPVEPIRISRQPESQSKKTGESATFSISVTGTGPFEYQWKKDGEIIPYAVLDTITIAPVKKEDAGTYTCDVKNMAGSVQSESAHLSVTEPVEPIRISRQPESQSKKTGESATFSISVTGTGPFEYQWKKDGEIIPYAVLDTITIAPVKKEDAGTYTCEVSNEFSKEISKEAILEVRESPKPALAPSAEKTGIPAVKTPAPSAKPKTPSVKKPSEARKQITAPRPDSFDVYLAAPEGQGQYVYNGNVIRFSGTAVPGVILQTAVLKDEKGFIIRDLAKGVHLNRKTGRISGSMFIGSFRRARSIFLYITVGTPSGKTLTGTSNSLTVDNTYPEINITTPADHTYFRSSPIEIEGTAIDTISGIALIEISVDGGTSYQRIDSFTDGRWRFLFTPDASAPMYTVQVRTNDHAGHSAVSKPLTIYYHPSSSVRPPAGTAKGPVEKPPDYQKGNADNPANEDGICTYRIISLAGSRFQPSDLFTLKEELAIIVKGYGGKEITLRIIEPSNNRVVFELSDYIPVNKNKMWKWKLSKTGIFKAELFVDGLPKDDVFFKIIQ